MKNKDFRLIKNKKLVGYYSKEAEGYKALHQLENGILQMAYEINIESGRMRSWITIAQKVNGELQTEKDIYGDEPRWVRML